MAWAPVRVKASGAPPAGLGNYAFWALGEAQAALSALPFGAAAAYPGVR